VPNDTNHTIYVWLDALTNYLTVAGYPEETYKNVWPADYQIIGKDIVKFHAIYWPAFLMAAGYELPKRLITHGYWTVNKVKMSKSLGNVVNPHTIIDKFGLDPVRYFLLSEGGFIDDGDFSEERLFMRLKGDLADNFGNLVGRCTSAALNPDNKVPFHGTFTEDDLQLIDMLKKLPSQVDQCYQNSEFTKATIHIVNVIVATNGFFTKNEPWKLKPKKNATPDPKSIERLGTIM
jgi:methionyl-tRNA synthetase